MDMVEYLLERGAAPNPRAIAHTALRAASIFGHEHVACMLLQAQADPNMCRWGITARDACTRCAYLRMCTRKYARLREWRVCLRIHVWVWVYVCTCVRVFLCVCVVSVRVYPCLSVCQ